MAFQIRAESWECLQGIGKWLWKKRLLKWILEAGPRQKELAFRGWIWVWNAIWSLLHKEAHAEQMGQGQEILCLPPWPSDQGQCLWGPLVLHKRGQSVPLLQMLQYHQWLPGKQEDLSESSQEWRFWVRDSRRNGQWIILGWWAGQFQVERVWGV